MTRPLSNGSFRFFGLMVWVSQQSSFGWQGQPSAHFAVDKPDIGDVPRRKYLGLVSSSLMGVVLGVRSVEASARNLPETTGADLSNIGTVETLTPIVALRSSLEKLGSQLAKVPSSPNLVIDTSIPRDEMAFKRIFDAYSDPVTYKQKFLDQNAFLIYYTKGFDGPGRANIEAGVNERQTEQFGLRNEAWIAWENFLAETAFLQEPNNDCLSYLNTTIRAIDAYLELAPLDDVKTAKSKVIGMLR